MVKKSRGRRAAPAAEPAAPLPDYATGDGGEDLADQLFASLDARQPAPALTGTMPVANGNAEPAADDAPKKMSRQKARMARRDEQVAAARAAAEREVAEAGEPDYAEIERQDIARQCEQLGVTMVEMNPDGHCLYAAIADQINVRHPTISVKYNYEMVRRAAAQHMRAHRAEFMPFVADDAEPASGGDNSEQGTCRRERARLTAARFAHYCDTVEHTSEWGGQPEIAALSQAFQSPIHVVQSGAPTIKFGEDHTSKPPLLISCVARVRAQRLTAQLPPPHVRAGRGVYNGVGIR